MTTAAEINPNSAASLPPNAHAAQQPGLAAPLLLLTAMTAALLVPFLNKAFHIDDPLFLWAARQIQHDPANPFGFKVNWYDSFEPLYKVTQNPPLACYYVAGAAAVLGWSEPALHSAFLLPAIGVILGVYFLARRFCHQPLLAALATLSTPVFLISSTSIMCDTLMLCFWVWALVAWVEASEPERRWGSSAALSVTSGLLVTAAALTKYFGISLIPLLLVYGLSRRRYGQLLALLIPAAGLVAYQHWTRGLYGQGLLNQPALYAVSARGTINLRPIGLIALNLLSFAGGCLLPALLLYPFLVGRRWLVWGGLGFVVVLLVLLLAHPESVKALNFADPLKPFTKELNVHLGIELALFATGGLAVLILAGLDLARHRNPEAWLLALWIVGTLLFTGFLNWTINGRSILPMAPAVGIILARAWDARWPLGNGRNGALFPPCRTGWRCLAALGVAAAVGLAAAWGDMSVANANRDAVRYVAAAYGQGSANLWFEGHWGFQYYAQRQGAHAMTLTQVTLAPGDIIMVPLNNSYIRPLNESVLKLRETYISPVFPAASVHSGYTGAGFYSDIYGSAPFVLGPTAPERFRIWEVMQGVSGSIRATKR